MSRSEVLEACEDDHRPRLGSCHYGRCAVVLDQGAPGIRAGEGAMLAGNWKSEIPRKKVGKLALQPGLKFGGEGEY